MSLSLPAGYLAARDVEADGGPVVPGTWGRWAEGDTGWWSLVHPSGDLLTAYRVNALSSRGLFAVFGDTSRLEAIAAGNDEVMPGRECWRRGYDHGGGPIDATTVLGGSQEATARQMLRGWRWWRCDGVDAGGAFSGEIRQLSTMGTLLPNLNTGVLPWLLDEDGGIVVSGQVVTVTRLQRPAFPPTIAGYALAATLEDEPDRSPP